MKTLALRQVKVLAPAALATALLGVVLGLVATTMQATAGVMIPPLEVAATLVLYVAPWLLGIATIAADGEAGGLAFLGTLPLSPLRHLALRAAVALGWTLVVVTPFVLVLEASTPAGLRGLPVHVAATPLLFVAALAAGATARQSLGAFLVTPLLALGPLVVYGAFVSIVRAPESALHLLMYPAVMIALAVAASRAFADPGRQLARRVVRVAGVLGGVVALGCGATTACWAAAALSPERQVSLHARGPVVVVFDDLVPEWRGLKTKRRTILLDPEAVARAKDLTTAFDAGWWREGRHQVWSTSPDGRLALLAGDQRHLELVDVRARSVVASPPLARVDQRAANPEWPRLHVPVAANACGWLDGEPWIVANDVADDVAGDCVVRRLGGQELLRLAPDARVLATGGARLIVAGADGARRVVDLRDGSSAPLPPGVFAALSPRGEALALGWPAGERLERVERLELRRLDEPDAPTTWLDLEGIDDQEQVTLRFSPDERRVVVEWQTVRLTPYGSRAVEARAADLARGEVRRAPPSVWPEVWSPAGTIYVEGGRTWVDLTESTLVARELPSRSPAYTRWAAWFDGERTLVRASLPDGAVERVTLQR